MISVDYPTHELVQKVLSESKHPKAHEAWKLMQLAAVQMMERELSNDQTPALLMRQAG